MIKEMERMDYLHLSIEYSNDVEFILAVGKCIDTSINVTMKRESVEI